MQLHHLYVYTIYNRLDSEKLWILKILYFLNNIKYITIIIASNLNAYTIYALYDKKHFNSIYIYNVDSFIQ